MKSVLLIASLCILVLVVLLRNEQLVSSQEGPMDLQSHNVDAFVVLHANENGHFFGKLSINGVSLKYIVDSGATNVTLNSGDANKANIDYTKGDVVDLVTPGGEVQAFSLKLNALMIGTIVLNEVEVTVVEGKAPPYVLLGTSAQNKLDVKRDNSIMILGKRR